MKFLSDDHRPLRCLLVTSPVRGEGKTFVATALAAAWAQAGYKTALVNWHGAGAVHPLLGVTPSHPLPMPPADGRHIADAMTPTPLPTLWLLSTDRPREIKGDTEQFSSLFTALRERVDVVIVDAPPVLRDADALLLTPLCDGVVMVAEADRTTKSALRKAAEQIRLAKGRLVAAALNKAT